MSSSQRRRERNSQRTTNTDDLVFPAFEPFAAPMTISVLNDPLEDDEAVARALQAEYEAEYRRSQRAMRNNPYPSNNSVPVGLIVATAPYDELRGSHRESSQIRGSQQQQRSSSRPSVRDIAFRGESVRRTEHVSSSDLALATSQQIAPERSRSRSKSRPSPQELSDEEYAWRLEREMSQARRESHQAKNTGRNSSKGRVTQGMSDEEYARRLSRELSNPRVIPPTAEVSFKRSQTPVTSRSDSEDDIAVEVAIMTADDEAYARRIEQELADERLAESIRRQELQRMDRQQASSLQQRQQPRSRRCLCTLFPILLIIGAVGGVLYFFLFGDEGLPNWMPSPEEFAEEDPFAQKGPDEVNKWRMSGNGLELEVLNALDDLWFPFFYTAVSEWDAGSPDAVTLKTGRVDADTDCRTIPGVLKVCNGDYGETSWRGINKLLLENDDIYASAARMNEFYFRGEDTDQRQYTMCHEIGHGLGLPHSDESFTNKDLGNCMDYTNRPDVNKQPDRSNYIFLAELYGTVPGSPPYIPDINTNGTVEAAAQVDGDNDDDDNRRLRGSSSRILDFVDELDHEIDLALVRAHKDWKLLHRSEFGEAHEKRLDDRYKVQVHFLLAG